MTAYPRSLDKLHRAHLADVRKGNMFHAYPHDIHEMEGFNPRDYSRQGVQQHIRNLADAYLSGQHVEPITVRVVDGKIYVVEGHCRRRGMLLAIEDGADLGQQPLIEFKGDEADAQKKILTSQMGEKLTTLELADMYQRMVNRGKTLAEIGEIVGKTAEHVRQTLDIHTLPDEIKQLIHEGTVSSDLATKTYNELGSEAIAVLVEGVEEQLVAGKKKLTPTALNKKRSWLSRRTAAAWCPGLPPLWPTRARPAVLLPAPVVLSFLVLFSSSSMFPIGFWVGVWALAARGCQQSVDLVHQCLRQKSKPSGGRSTTC
jgi:ParB-like chromosome segregation protein Spo0J